MYVTLSDSVVSGPANRDTQNSRIPQVTREKLKVGCGLNISQGLFNFQIIQIFSFVKKKRMGTSLDELLNAEFKEAFDEFDKVSKNIKNRPDKIFIKLLSSKNRPLTDLEEQESVRSSGS